jgi:hypothetical protein
MANATRSFLECANRFRGASRWLRAALAAAAFSAAGLTAAAPLTPFNYVLVDVFAGGPSDGTSVLSSTTGPVLVERGVTAGAFGKARAAFGSNEFAAQSKAAGGSMWSDGFVVTGGTGSGMLAVSVQIEGTVVGASPDMSYTLFLSDNPFDAQTILDSLMIDDQNPSVPGASSVLHTEIFHDGFHPTGALNIMLVGNIPFAYGQPFYLASLFGGDVGVAGDSEEFSAAFGITAPAAAVLQTQSQAVYASAVPEPATPVLVAMAALCVLLFGHRNTTGFSGVRLARHGPTGRTVRATPAQAGQ